MTQSQAIPQSKVSRNDEQQRRQLKVAVIHDWLIVYGGAERVLEHILDSYPQADLFSLIDHVPADQRHFLRGRKPRTSFMQQIPGVDRHYRKLLPLMPLAIEQLDLSGYDLVISSSYCVAKGVMTGPNQVHVSYCHSPMRYAWDHYHEYLNELNLKRGPKSWFARWQLHRIRTWDVRSSNSVDRFVANSKFVQARIGKYYGRPSTLVYPPIDTSTFQLSRDKEDFYVTAGRLVPFKRLDLVVDAFADMPERRLVLLGDGPEMAKLRGKAAPNVEFLGFQPPSVMRDYLSRARAFVFPSEEDFGIVPVEAQACGTPVIAFGSGGALETVIPVTDTRPAGKSTGLWFGEQTPESVRRAVERFESVAADFDPSFIAAHAASFSPERFRAELEQVVDAAMAERPYAPERCADPAPLPRVVASSAKPLPTAIIELNGIPLKLHDPAAIVEMLDATSAAAPLLITGLSKVDLARARSDRSYQVAINAADLALPASPQDVCKLTDTSGYFSFEDTLELIMARCARREASVRLLVEDRNSAEHLLARLAQRFPRVDFGSVLNLDELTVEDVAHELSEQRAEVLLIAGGPACDRWLLEARKRLPVDLLTRLPSERTTVPRRWQGQAQLARRAASRHWVEFLKFRAMAKRTFDLLFAGLGLLAASPLLLITAAAIRLESAGPVIFRQQRIGLRGRPFTMFKFRSMYADAESRLAELATQNESEGQLLFKMKRDPRVTRVGRFIRRFSIDELPQLLNVLRGEMTVVGPRPALPSEVAGYSLEERKRLQGKPGVTCLWQIGGRSDIGFEGQVQLDLAYLGEQSIRKDLGIVLRTAPAVLSGRGAY